MNFNGTTTMAKRNVTVESPAGARISVWNDEDGGITLCGSATPELRQNPDKCVTECMDVFADAIGTFFANIITEEEEY